MKKQVTFINLVLIINSITLAFAGDLPYTCKLPYWNSPAETDQGLFTGDLSLECSIPVDSKSQFDVAKLRKNVIDKIQSESSITRSPGLTSPELNSVLNWDVTHDLKEEGDSVRIREMIQLSTPNKDQLEYEAHSIEISATGMASYLKSVEFTMIFQRSSNQVTILFRNRVQVKRPWYALDLIFAPIARKTCVSKLARVKDKFMPWLIESLQKDQKEEAKEISAVSVAFDLKPL